MCNFKCTSIHDGECLDNPEAYAKSCEGCIAFENCSDCNNSECEDEE